MTPFGWSWLRPGAGIGPDGVRTGLRDYAMTNASTGAPPGGPEIPPPVAGSVRARLDGRLPLVFTGLLIAGAAASLATDARGIEAIANHAGGLGLLGLLACLSGYMAGRRGRRPLRAFAAGLALPALLGAAACLIVYISTGFMYCGGGVVLVAALLVLTWHARR